MIGKASSWRAVAPLCALACAGFAGCDGRACLHDEYLQVVDVQGSCGPSGSLTLHAARDACALDAVGAEPLGLPGSGSLGDGPLAAGGWSLTGTPAGAFRDCTAWTQPPGLLLRCNDGQPDACEALLLPR